MRQILYILSTVLFAISCNDKKNPEPVTPEPEVFKNSFVLMGDSFCSWHELWQQEDNLSVWCTEEDTKAGVATLTDGAGTKSANWTLKTNTDAGTKVRIFYPESASPQNRVLDGSSAFAWSDEVVLDDAWPVEFSFHSPLVYIRLVASAAPGTELSGATLGSVRFSAQGASLAGAFSIDYQKNAIIPANGAADWVEVTPSTPVVIGQQDCEIGMVVFPADLTGLKCEFLCSVTDTKGEARTVSAKLEGRKLEAGKTYTIRLQSLGGIITPGDRTKPEYSPVSIDYKVHATDAAFTKGSQTTLDAMNWLDKYNTNPCDRWGGLPGVKPDQITSSNPESFWRTGKKNGRHVMVDPDGNIALLHGVNGVAPETIKEASSAMGQKEFKAKFGTDWLAWASWAGQVVADAGFNFFSINTKRASVYADKITADIENTLHNPIEDKQLSHVELAYLLRTFRNDYNTASHSQRAFNDSELNVMALIFDPYYLDYIDGIAKRCGEISRGKKNFIGWFLDNELEFRVVNDTKPGVYLKDWLQLETGEGHCQAAQYAKEYAKKFMQDKYHVDPVPANVTQAMEDAFLLEVCRYYYRTASAAIRKYDPDHLVMGSRLHGRPRTTSQILKACAEYCDVVSMNIYAMWEPQDNYFVNNYSVWVSEWDKPFIVSEFYIRDLDATYEGKPYSKNGEGGGWYVRGQEDRGRFYQGYTRKLTSYSNCVGWEWFQMTDDYAESYNGWNNKGIVDPKYVPYEGIISYMRRHNWNIYQIMDYYFPGITQGASTEDIPGAVWEDLTDTGL